MRRSLSLQEVCQGGAVRSSLSLQEVHPNLNA